MILIIIVLIIVFFVIAFFCCLNEECKQAEEKKKELEEELKNRNFISAKSIEKYSKLINFDSKHKKIAFCNYSHIDYSIFIINYSEILDCEVLKNGKVVQKGGINRALVGGIVGGGVGAIVGSNTRKIENTTEYSVRIITSNFEKPTLILEFGSDETKAGELYGTIIGIMENSKKIEKSEKSNIDNFEQLKKLSELKEKNIITNEEFELKKKELLNKM